MRNKVTSSHSTFIPEAEALKNHMTGIREVVKIGAGIIKPSGASVRRIKIGAEVSCVLVKVRGTGAVQEVRFWFYNATRQIVEDAVKAFAIKQGWRLT